MQVHTLKAQKSVRKNFTMADEAVRDLDFLAEVLHKNRSQIIQELIRKEAGCDLILSNDTQFVSKDLQVMNSEVAKGGMLKLV